MITVRYDNISSSFLPISTFHNIHLKLVFTVCPLLLGIAPLFDFQIKYTTTYTCTKQIRRVRVPGRSDQEQGVVQLPGQEPPFRFRGTPPPHDQASDAAPKRWVRIDQFHQPEAKGLDPIYHIHVLLMPGHEFPINCGSQDGWKIPSDSKQDLNLVPLVSQSWS